MLAPVAVGVQSREADEVAFECEISLVTVASEPAEAELRAFWNVKENAVLDSVADVDRLWVGVTRAVTPEEPRSPGAAGHVFDLLFLVGTTPTYRLPTVDDELIERILQAFDAGGLDGLPALKRDDLAAFLRERRGQFVAPADVSMAS